MKKKSFWQLCLVAAAVFTLSSVALAQSSSEGSEETRWFVVDSLNAGLGDPPEAVQRITPRQAIRSFQALTDKGEFAAAAHVLNLSQLEPAEQQQQGAQLARRLAEILKRGELLQVSDLSGRQDAAIEDVSGQNSQAGKPRRNLKLASLKTHGETYDIRLGRYRVGDKEAVWLVMPESVSSVPVLYERYGPSWVEAYIPKRFKASFGVLKIWEWIAIPVFLMTVGLVGYGIFVLAGVATRLLPKGTPSIFVSRIRVPLALIAMSLITQVLLNYVVSFSAVATTSFRVLLIAILAWGAGTVAIRLVDTLMLKMIRRLTGQIDDTKPKDERRFLTTLYALRRIIILVTVSAVTIYVLSQIQLFETLGLSLLASASVLTVLVGIAGQAVLGNIISSFQLSLAKSIRIGDLVMFENEWCYVEGIFYTFIRLRAWNERRLIVPVTYFISRPFENLSVKSTKEYRSLEIPLHLSADIECLREKFMEYAKEEDNVIEHHKLSCYVTGQTEMVQTFACYLMTSDPFHGWTAEMNLREKMMAFIRDNHPEWWPRSAMVISRHDIEGDDKPEPVPDNGNGDGNNNGNDNDNHRSQPR
ncbi:mechanosensitive ion channel family protein [Onishia niordana]|uniref:mechanosensitive ion channel family protein n=1 Tax=Onishia niordana TaxID=2508711 RepID=UPI00109F1ED9|nr:mechanosensitive ion channel domain-containing protein [Halomonas niordiana]